MAKAEAKFLEINLPQDKAEEAKKVLDALKREKERYVNSADISDVAFYDGIKKRVLSYLSSLDNYRTLFRLEADRLDDYVKKELRSRIIMDMVKTKKASSYTAAERVIETDEDYLSYKKQLWEFKRISDSIRGRYDVYSNLFSSVVQSVSIAGKEKKDTQMAG